MEREFRIVIHITHSTQNGDTKLRISEWIDGKCNTAFICPLDDIRSTVDTFYGADVYLANEVVKMAEIYKLKHNLT